MKEAQLKGIIEKYGSLESYKEYLHKKLSKHFYTNGTVDIKRADGEEIPDGFYPGRSNGCGAFTKDRIAINNGKICKFIYKDEPLPDGFVKGQLAFTEDHKSKISKSLSGKKFTPEHCEKLTKIKRSDEFNQKRKKTLIEKYGVDCIFKRKDVIEKSHSEKTKEKRVNSLKKHNSFNRSLPEDKMWTFLCSLFDPNDVVRQYHDHRYSSYACDFYIKSLDLFIELNYT